jgi:hypothetical protein
MSEIVDLAIKRAEKFKKRIEMVWECDCGCQTFYITVDSEVKCRNCNYLQEDLLVSFSDQPN